MLCPCHSGKSYTTCCEPFHKGELPSTPEQLMRSRYSAYALNNADYIIETAVEKPDKESIEEFSTHTNFEGLTILETTEDTVTFFAKLSQDGKDVSFTEKSLFIKENGRWFYQSRVD